MSFDVLKKLNKTETNIPFKTQEPSNIVLYPVELLLCISIILYVFINTCVTCAIRPHIVTQILYCIEVLSEIQFPFFFYFDF